MLSETPCKIKVLSDQKGELLHKTRGQNKLSSFMKGAEWFKKKSSSSSLKISIKRMDINQDLYSCRIYGSFS